MVVSDVQVSSFLNKVFHCVIMAFASCNVHGSELEEETKVLTMRANMTNICTIKFMKRYNIGKHQNSQYFKIDN